MESGESAENTTIELREDEDEERVDENGNVNEPTREMIQIKQELIDEGEANMIRCTNNNEAPSREKEAVEERGGDDISDLDSDIEWDIGEDAEQLFLQFQLHMKLEEPDDEEYDPERHREEDEPIAPIAPNTSDEHLNTVEIVGENSENPSVTTTPTLLESNKQFQEIRTAGVLIDSDSESDIIWEEDEIKEEVKDVVVTKKIDVPKQAIPSKQVDALTRNLKRTLIDCTGGTRKKARGENGKRMKNTKIHCNCQQISHIAQECVEDGVIRMPVFALEKLLTRQKPQLMMSFDRTFYKKNTDTSGRIVGDFERSPLGCAFDPMLSVYISSFTASGKIRFITEFGKEKEDCISGLDHPSAIVINEPGKSFCFVDNQSIYEFSYLTHTLRLLVQKKERGYFRTLTCLSPTLITSCWMGYDSNGNNKINMEVYDLQFEDGVHRSVKRVDNYKYPIPKGIQYRVARPSFSTSSTNENGEKEMFITDLGLNRISLYSWNDASSELKHRGDVPVSDKYYGQGRRERIAGYPIGRPAGVPFFERISGICDVGSHLILCDAVKRKLLITQKNGVLEQEVLFSSQGPMPYTSQMAIGRRSMLTANRQEGGFSLFNIMAVPPKGVVVVKKEAKVFTVDE